MKTFISNVKSVTSNLGNTWTVERDKEVKEIEMYSAEAEEVSFFVVHLASGRTVNIPFHSVSHWIEFSGTENVSKNSTEGKCKCGASEFLHCCECSSPNCHIGLDVEEYNSATEFLEDIVDSYNYRIVSNDCPYLGDKQDKAAYKCNGLFVLRDGS